MATPPLTAVPTQRLQIVDALRGFALLGVYWANLNVFSGLALLSGAPLAAMTASPIDAAAHFLELFLIENKFMGLFSFLFGVSFWLFLSRVNARGAPGIALYYRRIGWLLVIGMLHGWLLWCFDILRFYALWALLLPLFLRMAPRRLLGCALGAGVLLPALIAGVRAELPAAAAGADLDAATLAVFASGRYPDVLAANWRYDWHLTLSMGQIAYQASVFGRLLLGLYVARTFDLERLGRHRPLLRRALLVGAGIGVVGSSVFTGILLPGDDAAPWLMFGRRLIIEAGQLGLTLAYAAALALVALRERWRAVPNALAPLGRMALTWYLVQTLSGIWLCYGFARGPALLGRLAPHHIAGLVAGGYTVQVIVACIWLRYFRIGPAEWLWRSLTYWKWQPFKARLPGGSSQT